jgi:hypothetical protein
LLCWVALAGFWLPGCKQAEPPLERIEIAAGHRACREDETCGVVETSCVSQGCECGVAVNAAFLRDYQSRLAECRADKDLATCDLKCETPFAKCFGGACVLTSEPPELFRRGKSLQTLCESTRGTYVGCPQCPPDEPCRSCVPCECPSSDRWTKTGCRPVVLTQARDIRVEARPAVVALDDKIKTRVHNDSKRTIWLKTMCGTPFYRARRKEDAWEVGYERFRDVKCRVGSVEIAPGSNRPFVVGSLNGLRSPSGEPPEPGTYRFEVTYTDGDKTFRYSAAVYSAELDLAPKLTRLDR